MEPDNLKYSLFYCSNSTNNSPNKKSPGMLAKSFKEKGLEIKMISLPCSGRINIQYLLKAIETGADGVILYTCKENGCQYIEGNMRAKNRVQAVNSILKESGFDSNRVMIIQANENDKIEQIVDKIKKFYNLNKQSENVIQ